LVSQIIILDSRPYEYACSSRLLLGGRRLSYAQLNTFEVGWFVQAVALAQEKILDGQLVKNDPRLLDNMHTLRGGWYLG
jgi:hypothetical protein